MRTAALAVFALVLQGEPFEGVGTMGPAGFTADGRKDPLKVESKQPLQGRVWLKGVVKEGALQVADAEPLPEKWETRVEGKSFSVALTEVYAWCDHMPVIGEAKNRRQHLKLSVSLKNKTDQPLDVKVARAFLSFDEKSEGAAASGLTGAVMLKDGEEKVLQLRGDGFFDEGNHAKTLFVALILAAGGERLGVRASGAVNETF